MSNAVERERDALPQGMEEHLTGTNVTACGSNQGEQVGGRKQHSLYTLHLVVLLTSTS